MNENPAFSVEQLGVGNWPQDERAMTSGSFGALDAGICAGCGHSMKMHDPDGDGDASGDNDGDGDGGCSEIGCDCGGYRTAPGEWDLRYAIAPITHVDVRDPSENGDGSWTMSGYAAVFDQKTTLFDGRFVQMTEDIAPNAFDKVLREQSDPVHFNYEHDMGSTVASTHVPAGQPGSLQLRVVAHGLGFLARVAKDDPDGQRMASKMRTGILGQASFAFKVSGAEDSTRDLGDGRQQEHRRITEVSTLRDVCATPLGAYRQTQVSLLRSYAAAIGQLTLYEVGGIPRQPDFGGETVSRASGGSAERRRALAQMMRDAHSLQRM